MILNIGESVNSHFKEIAWYTTHRVVRNVLVKLLLEANQLDEGEMELISKYLSLI